MLHFPAVYRLNMGRRSCFLPLALSLAAWMTSFPATIQYVALFFLLLIQMPLFFLPFIYSSCTSISCFSRFSRGLSCSYVSCLFVFFGLCFYPSNLFLLVFFLWLFITSGIWVFLFLLFPVQISAIHLWTLYILLGLIICFSTYIYILS